MTGGSIFSDRLAVLFDFKYLKFLPSMR